MTWKDLAMPSVVRAFPLRASRSELENFAAALKGDRSADADRFYRNYGITHESWHLQDTPHGPWVIAVSEIRDPAESAPRYAQATEEFHVWFKSRVLSLSGVDPTSMPLGPPTHEIFSWTDAAKQPSAGAHSSRT
jgi:hypothetical protein